jgi:Rieske Fe-S protein
MDGIRASVRAAVAVTLLLATGLLLAAAPPLVPAESDPALPVMKYVRGQEPTEPLPAPSGPGVTYGSWLGNPVIVVVAPASVLQGVDAQRGAGEATPSVPFPGDPSLRLFALSARSTHLGCTVGFVTSLGASRDVADYDLDGRVDGRILDPCSGQAQWDPYNRGAPVAGPTRDRSLAVLDVFVQDGHLYAKRFDGPVGPPAP